MKRILIALSFLCFGFTNIQAQQSGSDGNKFRTFSRPEANYVLGINEAINNQKINSFHIKLVIGLANSFTGFGIGLENVSFRAAGGSGSNFQTLNFTGNAHILAKPITTKELNYFVKAAVGYAPKIFREYNKGFNYQISPGALLTTKKGSKFFLQAVYNHQELAGFDFTDKKPKVNAVGLGIGAWF